MYTNTTCYVLKAATCITLNEQLADTKKLDSYPLFLCFTHYSLVEVIYLLIRLSHACETQRILIEMV